MFDSLIQTLLVVAALYVYLSLYRQVMVRRRGIIRRETAWLPGGDRGDPARRLVSPQSPRRLRSATIRFFRRGIFCSRAASHLCRYPSDRAPRAPRLQCDIVRRIFPARLWPDREHGGGSSFCRLSAALCGRRDLAWMLGGGRANNRSWRCLPARKRSMSESSSLSSRSRLLLSRRSLFFAFFFMACSSATSDAARVWS